MTLALNIIVVSPANVAVPGTQGIYARCTVDGPDVTGQIYGAVRDRPWEAVAWAIASYYRREVLKEPPNLASPKDLPVYPSPAVRGPAQDADLGQAAPAAAESGQRTLHGGQEDEPNDQRSVEHDQPQRAGASAAPTGPEAAAPLALEAPTARPRSARGRGARDGARPDGGGGEDAAQRRARARRAARTAK